MQQKSLPQANRSHYNLSIKRQKKKNSRVDIVWLLTWTGADADTIASAPLALSTPLNGERGRAMAAVVAVVIGIDA